METMNIYIKHHKKYIKVVTLIQAASKLRISRQAVLKRINSGYIRAARLRADVKSWPHK
jgi:ABC-type dipeptide/oligopeptide/nickel transport system permease component